MNRSRKAQSKTLSLLIIIMIVIVIILSSYVWGSRVLEGRKEAYSATRMKVKMFELRDAITSVVQDGANSTRVMSVSLDNGKLYLDTSFIPVSCGQQRRDNGIIYEVDTKERIVSSESWVNVDTYENQTGDLCTTGGPSLNYPGVLFAKTFGSGEGRYTTQYLLSFRNLKDADTGEHHIIRIGSSSIGQDTTSISGGAHTLMIRNEGSSFDSANSRWTHNIAVIFDP